MATRLEETAVYLLYIAVFIAIRRSSGGSYSTPAREQVAVGMGPLACTAVFLSVCL